MKYLLSFIAVLILHTGFSQKSKLSAPRLEKISYNSKATGLERDYYVYLPQGFKQKKDWPVMLFLHGNGERGNGKDELDYVFIHGPIFEAWCQKRNLPFVIIVPQLPVFNQGNKGFITSRTKSMIPYPKASGLNEYKPYYTGKEPMNGIPSDDNLPYPKEGQEDGWNKIEDELLAMVDNVIKNYKGDEHRVYFTGLSTGGFGVWYMGGTYPEIFAAMAPVAAFGHPTWPKIYTNIKCRSGISPGAGTICEYPIFLSHT